MLSLLRRMTFFFPIGEVEVTLLIELDEVTGVKITTPSFARRAAPLRAV